MPVKIYVRLDSGDRELPPMFSHESWATLDLIHRIWTAYSISSTAFAIAVNLEKPSADLIIVSQRGIGIVELKDVPGDIRPSRDGSWHNAYQGSLKRISGGKRKGVPRLNPHEQVREYAYIVKQRSQRRLTEWTGKDASDFKFNTAVCFTHPTANIKALKEAYESPYHDWERFQLLTPQDIVKWVHTISFEDEQQAGRRYERTYLMKSQVFALPEQLFDMVESTEIPGTILSGEPYAYLTLIEDSKPAQVFSLHPGGTIIGRDPKSNVSIPMHYGSVSRCHARILYSPKGAFIEDLDSRYGTYVDGRRVKAESLKLKETHTITLCLPDDSDKRTCVLIYEKSPPSPPSTWSMTHQ